MSRAPLQLSSSKLNFKGKYKHNNTISEINKSLFKSRLHTAQVKISECKDRATENCIVIYEICTMGL